MTEIVNTQKQTNLQNSNSITNSEFAQTQKQLPTTWSKSRPFHFVATCEFDYISDENLKGIIHEINQNMPYFINNEIGSNPTGILYGDHDNNHDGEHWHLFFYSSKSINTVKKKLTELGFLNLRYSDPNNKKYTKYKVSKDIEPCIVYLSKGVTNHMKTTDDLDVMPIIRLTNLTDIELETHRQRYEEIITEMIEKQKDFKNNMKQKHKSDTEHVLAYMQGKSPDEIITELPKFFLENSTIKESDFKYTNYFITCIKKYHPDVYRDYRERQMRKKFEEIL